MIGGKHYFEDYKPVNVFQNNIKLAGWHNETKTGETVEFDNTYNDFAEVAINGNTEQTTTTELISNPLSQYIIPFRCGAGVFDMAYSGMTNAKWLYNGILYVQSRLQLTTLDDEVVWLLADGFSESSMISNNSIAQPIKLDLADFQGKITHYFRLSNCTQITGSVADLQGKITQYLSLINCNLITGAYIPASSGVPISTYLDYTSISPQDMDTTLIAYANTTKINGTFSATGMVRTTDSNDAVTTLQGMGWTISGMGVI